MNRAKYLLAIFVATVVYVVLSLFIGPNSIKCFKELEEQKRIVSVQESEIQNINTELRMEVAALKNDSDVIAAYARKLDYVGDNEKLVKITGLKPAQITLYDTGTVVRHKEPEYCPESFCKLISIITGFFTLILLLFFDIRDGNIDFHRQKKASVAGIPVYDLPQV